MGELGIGLHPGHSRAKAMVGEQETRKGSNERG